MLRADGFPPRLIANGRDDQKNEPEQNEVQPPGHYAHLRCFLAGAQIEQTR